MLVSFSTSLGAVCHELSHTFDLGHTVDGIMGRDFDRVGTLFTYDGSTKTRNRNDSLIIDEGTIRRKLNINFSTSNPNNSNIPHTENSQLTGRRVNLNEMFPRTRFWFGGCATLLAYHR